MILRAVCRFETIGEIRFRRAASPWRRELEAVCTQLAGLSGEVENRFLACGRALQEQVGLTGQLGRQGRELQEFGRRIERGEAALGRVSALITAHLDLSEEFAREIERLAVTLDDYAGQVEQLLRDQELLERSFAPMRVLHSFFRIESAVLPAELQALFNAVTADLQRLYTDVTAGFSTHREALSQTRDRVLATAQDLHAQSTHHAELIARKRIDVRDSLGRLNVELDRTKLRNQRLDAAIGEINREIDALTVSLQFQDITRQKMEHVQAAAREIITPTTARAKGEWEKRVGVQRVLCQVQAVQLGAVQQELAQATTTITSGLSSLLERLQWIERECLSVSGLKQVTDGMDAVTTEMMEAHRVTAEIMQRSATSFTQAIQTARGFAAATTGATDTMRRLAAELHLIGLNAQVQAVHANNGSLEVLAGAAATISGEAGTLTLSFESKLVAMTERLSTFVSGRETFHERAGARHASLLEEDRTLFRQMQEEHAAGRTLVRTVGSLLQQLKRQADDLLGSIDLAEFSRDPLDHGREVFASLAEVCANATRGRATGDEAILAEVQNRYTMSSERSAHAAVVAGTLASGAVLASALPTEMATGDVELFDEPEPAEAAAKAPLGDNVELF